MIRLTRLNGTELYLNADLIATVEARPDTVVTLVDGKHFVVADAAAAVVESITRYRASVLALADELAGPPPAPEGEDRRGLYVVHGERD